MIPLIVLLLGFVIFLLLLAGIVHIALVPFSLTVLFAKLTGKHLAIFIDTKTRTVKIKAVKREKDTIKAGERVVKVSENSDVVRLAGVPTYVCIDDEPVVARLKPVIVYDDQGNAIVYKNVPVTHITTNDIEQLIKFIELLLSSDALQLTKKASGKVTIGGFSFPWWIIFVIIMIAGVGLVVIKFFF